MHLPQFTLEPQTGNLNLLGRITVDLSPSWQQVITASLFRSEAEAVTGHSLVGPYVPQNVAVGPGVAPHLVPNPQNPGAAARQYPGNSFGAPVGFIYFFPELGLADTQTVTDTYRLFYELKGRAAGWDLEASAGAMYSALTQKANAQLDYNALQSALNDGYRLGSADGAALFAPTIEVKDTNQLEVIDLRATRALAQLPGGPLSLGAGPGFDHRYLYALAPPTVASGMQTGNNSYAIGSQNDLNAHAELVLPVLRTLELDAAARFDHYSTFGSAATPKFGLRYAPLRLLTLRGTYGRAVRTPNPNEGGQSAQAANAGNIADPLLCLTDSQGRQLPGSFPATCNTDLTALLLGNPHLQPEKSTSFTLGAILNPLSQLKVSFDYWNITVKQDIVSSANVDVDEPLARGLAADPRAAASQWHAGTGPDPGRGDPLSELSLHQRHAQRTSMASMSTSKVAPSSGARGGCTSTLDYSHLSHFVLTDVDGNSYELAGTHGPVIISGDSGTPKDRAVLTLGWERREFSVTGTVNYVGSFNLTDPCFGLNTCTDALVNSGRWAYGSPYDGPASFCTVKRFIDLDLYTAYALSAHLGVHAAALNVFGKDPPLDLETYGGGAGAAFDGALHDAGAIGRFLQPRRHLQLLSSARVGAIDAAFLSVGQSPSPGMGRGRITKEKFDACLVVCVSGCRRPVPPGLRLQHSATEGRGR